MAGLEERLKRLEGILNNLFCCDTNQFTGPQGPPGPTGPTGPAGPEGAIIFENLNWMGEFVPCVVYDQFDAVSYLGSSYFLNCESSFSFQCETPLDNECWVLLANAGAPGATGPQGISGNDGSNSGRWSYQGLSGLGLPPTSGFTCDDSLLSNIFFITINQKSIGLANYYSWLDILNNLAYIAEPPAFLQITQVGNNSVIGLFQVIGTSGFYGTVGNQSLKLGVNYVGGQAVNLVPGTQYSISWVINGVVNAVNKTVGNLMATDIPGTELIYDFNIVKSASKTACVYLPNTTQVGKEVVVFSTKTENVGFYVQSNSQITIDPSLLLPVSTGYLTTHGIDEGADNYFVYPSGNYKFTFLGNTAAGGKAFWNMEALPNTYFSLIPGDNLFDSSTELFNQHYTASAVTLTTSALNALFPDLVAGEQVFAPYQPGGPKIFVKTAFSWYSTVLTIVT